MKYPDSVNGKVAVISHIYYIEHWSEIAEKIKNIPVGYKLYVTVPPEKYSQFETVIKHDFPEADLRAFPNRGRDVAPFMHLLPEVISAGYELVCKVHAKRDVQGFGDAWRKAMLNGVLGSRELVEDILKNFSEDPELGMVGPSALNISARSIMCENEPNLIKIWQVMHPGSDLPEDWAFFAGSVYWSRTAPLIRLSEVIEQFPFEEDNFQSDGQIAHAVERLFGLSLTFAGYRFGLVNSELNLAPKKIAKKVTPPDCAMRSRVPHILSDLVQARGHAFFLGQRPLRPDRPNVLLVAHSAGWERYGGEQSFLSDMVKGAAGLNINLYACLPEASPDYLEEVLKYTNGTVVFPYEQWQSNNPLDQVALARFASIYYQYKIDLVHVNTIMIREALAAARQSGILSAVHVREVISEDPDLSAIIGVDPAEIIKRVLDSADHIIANSDYAAAAYPKPDSSFVIPNTVDLDAFDIPNQGGDYLDIAMVSSNIPKKGLHDFVALANKSREQLPRARFFLIGQHTKHIDEIIEQKKRGEVSENLFYLGYRENPAEAIGTGNVIVNLSSVAESFGRTVLEAMAARRPVLVYNRGALPDLVEENETGYVIPYKNIDAAVPLLARMAENLASLQSMGEKGRLRAAARYTLTSYRESLARIYAAILKDDSLLVPSLELLPQEIAEPGPFPVGFLAAGEEGAAQVPFDYTAGKVQGISIILVKNDEDDDFSGLFKSFSEHNTYRPLEFIFIDHAPTGNLDRAVQKWSATLPIRYLKRNKNASRAASRKFAAAHASYPLLLFMSGQLKYNKDLLKLAAAQLQDQKIGAVGLRIDDDPLSLPPGRKPAVQHLGVKFSWDKKDSFYRPLTLRLGSIEEADQVQDALYPALGGAFLLCRRDDFLELGGFYEGYYGNFAEIDLCLQLYFQLQKKCLCINSYSLQHPYDLPRKAEKKIIEIAKQDRVNTECFKMRVNKKIAANPDLFSIKPGAGPEPEQIKVGLVVCVHNALEDVSNCLEAVVRNTTTPYHLYIINDGSNPETTDYLRRFAQERQAVTTLLENEKALGYTGAANTGIRAAVEDYVVLLNSDTIVPCNWLKPLVALAESDPQIGVVGPLSNAATYQSVPGVKTETGRWQINPLPEGFSVDEMAELISELSERLYPRVPYINGFCYMIKRQVIRKIGCFDQENFPVAYGEENDYSLRVRQAGFTLAIADDAYVYHAQAKSYTSQEKSELSQAGRRALNKKYGPERLLEDIELMEKETANLDRLRERLKRHLAESKRAARPLRVFWLLMGHGGGGGGAHSIITEAAEMNRLPDVEARVAVKETDASKCLESYPEISADTFYFFTDEEKLVEYGQTFDVVVATHFKTFTMLEKIYYRPGSKILPAYYIQDYEPWIIAKERKELIPEALRTYTALPGTLLFAKTAWLLRVLYQEQGVELRQVIPSIDTTLYNMGRRKPRPEEGPIRIAAMVRPHTIRRAPRETMQLLKDTKESYGEKVKITIFGNEPQSALFKMLPRDFSFENRGILKRSEVAALLAESDIFVDISYFQAFGRTAVEAMAVGCAVIVPREGGVHEFALHEHNALIVNSKNMAEAKAALARLVDDDDLRNKLAANAARVTERFNVRAAAWSEVDLMRRELDQHLVTIIVPVYNALDETVACLESVGHHTHGPHQVLLIDDCSPDQAIWPTLKRIADQHGWLAIRNEENLGYTATVNKGCRLAQGDVVLLNSDTIVTAGWLDKLRQAAGSADNVATVTPLANAAGAFSLPDNNQDNPLPAGLSLEQMSALVEREAPRLYLQVPTGNGFCLYIRREALDKVGLFDEKAFPRGYGEENDFCQRAIEKGFINIIDDSTFIFHHRSASFKESKEKIADQNAETLHRRWPGYAGAVQNWLKNDPLDSFREKLKGKIIEFQNMASAKKTLLYVHHAGGGGVPLTNRDLLGQVSYHHDCYLLVSGLTGWSLYCWQNGREALVKEYRFKKPWRIQDDLTEDRRAALQEVCEKLQPDLVHIRHFVANHPAIIHTFKEYGLPVVISLHDFYTLCPTIQLVDNHDRYCAGYCDSGEGECPTDLYWFKDIPPLKNNFVRRWHETVAPALSRCDVYVVTSESTRRVLQQHYPFLNKGRVEIIEHGHNLENYRWVSKVPQPQEPLRLVAFGALGRNKGVKLIGELLRLHEQSRVPYQIDILGEVDFTFKPGDYPNCHYHGPYKRDRLPELLAGIKPALSLVASTWPETYCHTLTESWAAGLPVLGSNLGAVDERINKYGGGWVLDPRNPEAWLDQIAEIALSSDVYEQRREEIKKMRFKSVYEMANDYLCLYRRLM